jgi:hypothetical protein
MFPRRMSVIIQYWFFCVDAVMQNLMCYSGTEACDVVMPKLAGLVYFRVSVCYVTYRPFEMLRRCLKLH